MSSTGRTAQRSVAIASAVGLALVAALAFRAATPSGDGATLAAATALGALGGLGLYHASFGFTGGWRRFQRERRGAGVRAQLLLLGLVVVVAYPLIASGAVGRGWVMPMGVASAIGAAMFGFGMQLGGGCGSGVLFTVGGGSTRMVVTLAAFVGGTMLWMGTRRDFNAAVDGAWIGLGFEGPSRMSGVSLLSEIGAPGALAVSLAVLAALWLGTVWIERRAHGDVERVGGAGGLTDPTPSPGATGWLTHGPWTRAMGAVVLAAVVIGCFFLLGRPWGITSAYQLWGAHVAELAGDDLSAWVGGAPNRSVFADATSVMNFGIILGALGAAGMAGRFAPQASVSGRDVATAIVGGMLMGYGARLAFGCNIGGLVGGVASASLHGWWWLVFGALGSVAGVWARRLIGMDPPAPRRAAPAAGA